mgnify:CR=1 FL=1
MAKINSIQFRDNFQYFDKEIVLEIINIFIDEHSARINTISDSIKANDYDGIKFNCHSIKGVIANFCAPEVEEQAKKLELMGTNQNTEGIGDLFEDFKVSSSQMVDELEVMKLEYT